MSDAVDLLGGKSIRLRRGISLQVCHSPGQTPTLVFLHGGLGNRYNWRSQYEFAVAQGWEALAYDLAGHGQSETDPSYSIGQHCRDLTRLLRRHHIQRPLLCCHSYGVPLGLEWARQHPARGLVLIAGGTHDLATWWEMPLMRFLKWGGRHLYRLPGLQKLTQAVSTTHTHPRLDRFFAESPVPTEASPYEALEIFWQYDFFARGVSKRLRQLPALVVSGGQDPMFTEQMGVELADQFINGQHLHLLNGGHLMMAEDAEGINRAIGQFVGQLGVVD